MAAPVGSPNHGLSLRPYGQASTINTLLSDNSIIPSNRPNYYPRSGPYGYIFMDDVPSSFESSPSVRADAVRTDPNIYGGSALLQNQHDMRMSSLPSGYPYEPPRLSPSWDFGSTLNTTSFTTSRNPETQATSPDKEASIPAASSDQKRKPIEGDCSICWEAFEEKINELVYCKTTCGNNFHKKCFVEWLVTPKHQRAGPDLKCPYCRGPWEATELRQLQIDNGIVPPRPYKRSRPDVAAQARRDMTRRLYRERQNSRHSSNTSLPTAPRYPSLYRPMSYRAASTVSTSPPMSSSVSAQMSAQNCPAPTHSTSYPSPRTNLTSPPAQHMSFMSQRSPPPYMHVPYNPYPMQQQLSPALVSHDLSAPGYTSPPDMSSNVPYMYSSFEPSQSRCPAMQAQVSSYTNPQTISMQPTVPFCPGSATSFEFQQWNVQQTYTFYAERQYNQYPQEY